MNARIETQLESSYAAIDAALESGSTARVEGSHLPVLFGRFQVLDELGAGAFGSVLRCRDSLTGTVVALKELRQLGADVLLRFKNEFRTLCNVRSDHLVRVIELFEVDGTWAFTMDVIEGKDVVAWVRDTTHPSGFDPARLRRVLVGLARGLHALHGYGLVHSDVKPQNARVTAEGRAVLLDFGMVSMFGSKHADDRVGGGTVAYMAPEQFADGPPTPALDCYALGVVAYEAMTGVLPFVGNSSEIIAQKRVGVPRLPSQLVEGIDPELEALCLGLMQPEPAQRLSVQCVLKVFHADAPASVAEQASSEEPEIFIGRRRELDQLHQSLQQVLHGNPSFTVVEGESGVGKTALVHRFIEEVRDQYPRSWAFGGRCHVNEQIGYKAFDGIVDQITRQLSTLEDNERNALLPRDRHMLPALFPVFARVGEAGSRLAFQDSEHIERFPVFRAFAELLLRMANERLLVLTIDDLQWSDQESLLLLKAVLDVLGHARLLIIATYRPLAGMAHDVDVLLHDLMHKASTRRLPISGLSGADAGALFRALSGGHEAQERLDRVVHESGGHPLFVAELAREHARGRSSHAHDLDEHIQMRLSLLDVRQQQVLRLLAVSGSPIRQRTLAEASGLDSQQLAFAMRQLREGRWVTTVRSNEFVVYHDRIRDVVEADLGEDRRRSLHRSLACAHEHTTDPDPATVAQHWLASAQPLAARSWLEQAATRATKAAAPERAVEYYRQRLELDREPHCDSPSDRARLRLLYADSLASAGRSRDAARAVSEWLATTSERDKPELLVRGAQYLLQAGDVDSGVRAAKRAMQAVGLAWPRNRFTAALRYSSHRLAMLLGGTFTAPKSEPVSEQSRRELETLWRLWQPMLWSDFLRGVELGARHLRASMRSASPSHLTLALSQEAVLQTMLRPTSDRGERLLRRAESWLAQTESPSLRAYHSFARGSAATFSWDMVGARVHLEQAERIYREQCPAEPWQLANARVPLLNAWLLYGAHRLFADRADAWIAEAELRGDAFARAVYVVTGVGACRHLMNDSPERALTEIEEAMRPWRHAPKGLQYFMQMLSIHNALLYRGHGESDAHWAAVWPQLARSAVMRVGFVSDLLKLVRVEAALAATHQVPPATHELSRIHTLARSLRSVVTPQGRACADLARAQVAAWTGDPVRARRYAVRAHDAFYKQGVMHGRFAALLITWADDPNQVGTHEGELHGWLHSEGWQDPNRAMNLWLPAWRHLRSKAALVG